MSELAARKAIIAHLRAKVPGVPYVEPDVAFNPKAEADMAPSPVGGVYVELVYQGAGSPLSLGTAGNAQTWEWREMLTCIVRASAALDTGAAGRMPGQTVTETWDALLVALVGLDLLTGEPSEVLSFETPALGFDGNDGAEYRKDLQVLVTRQATVTRATP